MGIKGILRAAYRKFNRGEIIFTSDGGRRISLKGWKSYLDVSQKNCVSGFVSVEELLLLCNEGELRSADVIHVAVFRQDFSDTTVKVKLGELQTPKIRESRAAEVETLR